MYTKADVLEILEEIVKDNGTDHTATCRYGVKKGEPICIVGHLLDRVGLLDRAKEGEPVDELGLEDEFTPGAIHLMTLAQLIQDLHDTWGKALDKVHGDYDVITDDGDYAV